MDSDKSSLGKSVEGVPGVTTRAGGRPLHLHDRRRRLLRPRGCRGWQYAMGLPVDGSPTSGSGPSTSVLPTPTATTSGGRQEDEDDGAREVDGHTTFRIPDDGVPPTTAEKRAPDGDDGEDQEGAGEDHEGAGE
ncbi:hypothetical protein KC19_N045500 [Ceratodon purpureus]|nr:hypothetical protein KC19_N045500 [Ceratodon purpureus]